MASEIYLLAVDDVTLDDLEMPAAMLTDESDRYNWSTRREQGTESSAFFGAQHEDAVYSVIFQCPSAAAHDAIFGTLISTMGSERRLLAYRNDADETRVTTQAVATNIDEISDLDFTVEFEAATALWVEETSTLSSKTLTSSRDNAMHIAVPGNSRVSPSLRLSPLASRTAPSSFAGWSRRRRYTLTNNADEPLYRYPWRISLGSTTALVSGGTALSSGNDVRVVLDGIEQSRTLVTWNSANSYVWVIIPALLPGDDITFEVWYGNSAAGAPPTLAWPDLPPFKLATSTNASWVFPSDDVVGNAGLGLWWLSKGTEGAIADDGVPGSWKMLATLENPDTTDMTVQFRASLVTSVYVARLDAKRAAGNSTVMDAENGFDGVGIYTPLGITSFTGSVAWTNTGGLSSMMALARDSASEGWTRLISNPAASGTLTMDVATISPPTKWFSISIWPDNFWNIDPVDTTTTPAVTGTELNIAAAVGSTDWTVGIDSTKIAEALSATTSTPWTPPTLGGTLQAQYDGSTIVGVSNGGTLSQWPDLSANARHASQSTTSQRPIYRTNQLNALPAVDFDGTDDNLQANLTASSRDETIVMVVKSDGASGTIVGASSNDGRTLTYDGTADTFKIVKRGGATLGTSTGTVAAAAWAIVTATITSSAIVFSVNGVQQASISNSTTFGNGKLTRLGGSNANDNWGGIIAEIGFAKALSLADVQKWEGYLAWKWGLVSTGLPVGHPYKSAAPGTSGGVGGSVTEQTIYELATEVRIGGGDSAVAPYHAMLIGNARQQTGAGTPRAACQLSEAVLIDTERRAHEIWIADFTAKLEDLSAHAVQAVEGWDDEGATAESPATEWLPLLPYRPPVPNGDFATDTGGWEADTTDEGFTLTRTWDSAVGGDVDGSLAITVTANSAANNAYIRTIGSKAFAVAGRESVTIAAFVQTTNANLRPRLYIRWYDEDDAPLTTVTQSAWTPVANEPVRTTFAATPPARATSYQIGLAVRTSGTGNTGTIWFDDVTANDNDLYVKDEAVGQLSIVAAIRGRWL